MSSSRKSTHRHGRRGSKPHRVLWPLIVVTLIVAVSGTGLAVWKWGRAGGPGETVGTESRPNILLISIDTLRADRLGCYGYAGARTPTIDRLAAEGVVFESAVSPAPITLPSHATMLTGLIPPHHGVRDNGTHRLPDEYITVAEALKERGYQTAAFLGAVPLQKRGGLSQGFEIYDDDMPLRGVGGTRVRRQERYATEVFDAARAWLLRTDSKRPVFAFIHVYDPHSPYERAIPGSAPGYDGEIAFVDQALGDFFKRLGESGKNRRFTTILTSDHGEGLGEHGEDTHCIFVYESTMHVPLIVHAPGDIASHRVTQVVGVVDVTPTIVHLAGGSPLPRVDGRSLSPLIGGQSLAPQPVYFESYYGALRFGWAPLRGLRDGTMKLIDAPRAELFDLTKDPNELANIHKADDPRVRAWMRALAVIGEGRRASIAIDDSTRKGLEDLGYLSAPGVDSENAAPDPKDRISTYEQFQEAHRLFQQGDAEGGLNAFARVETAFKNSPYFFLEWGNFAAASGDWKRAQYCYHKAISLEPGEIDAYLNLGVAYLKQGDATKALRYFESAIRMDDNLATAHLYAGEVLRSDPTRAADVAAHWRRFVELAPEHPQAEDIKRIVDAMGS